MSYCQIYMFKDISDAVLFLISHFFKLTFLFLLQRTERKEKCSICTESLKHVWQHQNSQDVQYRRISKQKDFLRLSRYHIQFLCSSTDANILNTLHSTGCHALLQGIFLTQGSNPGLLNCRQTLLVEPPRKPTFHTLRTALFLKDLVYSVLIQ